MKAKKTSFIIVGIVVIVAVIAVFAFMLGRGTSVDDHVASSPAVPSETTTNAPEETSGEQENYPGAMIGNTQRTWPSDNPAFDDAAHAKPGTYSVDWLWQRPVWTPVNHDGDFPETVKSGGWEQCENPAEIRLEGKNQQQYINARYLPVNEFAGPTRLERGVPRGYAHSPQGAVAMALALASYAIPNQGDEIGEEIDAVLWGTLASSKKYHETRKIEWTQEEMQWSRASSLPPSALFKVVTCSENAMVIEIALDAPVDSEDGKIKILLFWREGDWQPDFTGIPETRESQRVNNFDGFTEVTYS